MVLNCNYPISGYLNLTQFVFLSLVLISAYCLLYFKSVPLVNKWVFVGPVLTISGGLLNITERLMSGGCVRDYIGFFGLFVFNIFDLMVTFGIFFSLFALFFIKDGYQKNI